MVIRKIVVCTAWALSAVAAAGCADGTGSALTPILPTPTGAATSNPDGSLLKATVPQPVSPRSATRVSNLTPTLRLANATPQFDPSASLSYVFQVYDGSTLLAESAPVSSFSSETTWVVPTNTLKINKTYSWRGRAVFNGVAGSWSDSASFNTPLPVADGPGPVRCAGSNGIDLVNCVANAFPTYLDPTGKGDNSLGRRQANMAFIRDRIIETGICKGWDLGRNFKRGGPEISFDYLVLRSNVGKGGRDRGVDLAAGYDDVDLPLRLKWDVQGSDKEWGYPFYSAYGPVDCSSVQ